LSFRVHVPFALLDHDLTVNASLGRGRVDLVDVFTVLEREAVNGFERAWAVLLVSVDAARGAARVGHRA
jgi:hypothetical protein